MVILGALGVAIYFIVDDAIDRKVTACLTKHFHEQRLFQAFNISEPVDVTTITYTTDDCKSIIEKGYEKTRLKVDTFPYDSCVKTAFKNKPFLDTVMLYMVLTKQGHNATAILTGAKAKASNGCNNQNQAN